MVKYGSFAFERTRTRVTEGFNRIMNAGAISFLSHLNSSDMIYQKQKRNRTVKTTVSVSLRLFIDSNERCNTINAPITDQPLKSERLKIIAYLGALEKWLHSAME